MKLNLMLEIEESIREIELRAERNCTGMLVTKEVTEYRAHGAKRDVEVLLGAVNAVLDKLVGAGEVVRSESVLAAIHGAMEETKEEGQDADV